MYSEVVGGEAFFHSWGMFPLGDLTADMPVPTHYEILKANKEIHDTLPFNVSIAPTIVHLFTTQSDMFFVIHCNFNKITSLSMYLFIGKKN